MESILESATADLVSRSLDMALLRHKVIANNIANADTPGYKPLKIDFESAMRTANDNFNSHGNVTLFRSELEQAEKLSRVEVDDSFVKVVLDREMVNLNKNTINYQAILSARGQLASILSMAIKGGRG